MRVVSDMSHKMSNGRARCIEHAKCGQPLLQLVSAANTVAETNLRCDEQL